VKNFLFQLVRYLQVQQQTCGTLTVLAHSFTLNDSDNAQNSVPSSSTSMMSLCAAGVQRVWQLRSTRLCCSHCKRLADRTRLYQQMCEVWHAEQLWDGCTSAVIMLTVPNVVVEWHSSVFEKTKGQTLLRFLAIFPSCCRWTSRWSGRQLKLVHDCFLHILSDSTFMVFAWCEWGKILKILVQLVFHKGSNQAPCK
jgi:hypothetical protein